MVACHSKTPDPTIPPTIPTIEPTDPTTAPTEPTEPTPIVFRQEAPFSKEGVPEFMDLLYKKRPTLANSVNAQERDCYNDTPSGVFEETGVQIFSFESSYKSVLMFDDELYYLENGHFMLIDIMTNAIPYDYDGDGAKDLIISFYADTGGYYCNRVVVFNPISKEITRVYSATLDDAFSTLYITKAEDNSQTSFTIWYVNLKIKSEKKWIGETDNRIEDYNLLWKKSTVTGIAGYLKTVDGSLQFVPYTE